MGIFDKILGKKVEKKEEKERKKKPEPVLKEKTGKKEKKAKTEKTKVVKKKKTLKKEENLAHAVLLEPLVSEKGSLLGRLNKYIFKVHPQSRKRQIQSAIEDYYGVKVTKVHIVKIRPKKRIHGRTIGWKKGFKKAVVTLEEGDTIGVAEGV